MLFRRLLNCFLHHVPHVLCYNSPLPLTFHGCCLCRTNDWQCLPGSGTVAQFCHVSLKPRSVSPQSTSTHQNIFYLFSEQPLVIGPSKRLFTIAWLGKWKEMRHKIWCTRILFCHNCVLLSLLSFACQNITQLTRAVIRLPSECLAFLFAAQAVDGFHNYSCNDWL